MKEVWQTSQDHKTGRRLGISHTLKLTVEAESLPALRESIEQAEGAPESFIQPKLTFQIILFRLVLVAGLLIIIARFIFLFPPEHQFLVGGWCVVVVTCLAVVFNRKNWRKKIWRW